MELKVLKDNADTFLAKCEKCVHANGRRCQLLGTERAKNFGAMLALKLAVLAEHSSWEQYWESLGEPCSSFSQSF